MRATPTRWDLLLLCRAELVRRSAGHPQLLSAVPPLAGAVAFGLLKAELGRDGKGELRYTSPHQVLTSNLGGLQEVEEPPLWFEDGTHSPPRLPTPDELEAADRWWDNRRTVNQRSSTTATLGAGSAAVLPPGQKRAGKRPARLVEECRNR